MNRIINSNILTELNRCLADVNNHIYLIESNTKMCGGSKLSDLTEKIKHDLKSHSYSNEKMLAKLKEFESHIKDVIKEFNEINDSNLITSKARSEFDRLSTDIDNFVKSKGYKIIDTDTRNILDNSGNRFLSSLFNIWTPFVTEYEKIIEVAESTDVNTLRILKDQCEQNIFTLGLFEDVLSTVLKKIQTNENLTPRYKIQEQTLTEIKYSFQDSDGILALTNDKPYSYKKTINLVNVDFLTLIETNKLKFIDEYVKYIKTNSNLDLEKPTVSISEDIIDSVKKLETINVQKGGEIKEFDVFNSILSLTEKMNQVNKLLSNVKTKINESIEFKNKLHYYLLYLSETLTVKNIQLTVYRYIDKDTLKFYLDILNGIKSNIHSNVETLVEYFNKFHELMLDQTINCLQFLCDSIGDKLIDISRCTGHVVFDMVLFNHFKDILENYYETQNKHVYSLSQNDIKLGLIDKQLDKFTNPSLIEMYMSIGTAISKKKDVCLIACTQLDNNFFQSVLFGTSDSKGILQSALENVSDVLYRNYELYEVSAKYNCNSSYIESDKSYTTTNVRNFSGVAQNALSVNHDLRFLKVYEFVIKNNNDKINLKIINLTLQPESESIERVDINFDTPFYRALISSMKTEPLYLAILCPSLVINGFNNLDTIIRKSVLTQIKGAKFDSKSMSDVVKIDDYKFVMHKNRFYQKRMNIREINTGANIKSNSNIYNFDELIEPEILVLNLDGWTNPKYLSKLQTTIQYQAVVSLHILNHILTMKDEPTKRTILEAIYEQVCKKFGFDKSIRSSFENIFINENIAGLKRFLNEDLSQFSKQEIKLDLIKTIKQTLIDLYISESEKVYMNNTVLNTIYEQNKTFKTDCKTMIEKNINKANVKVLVL